MHKYLPHFLVFSIILLFVGCTKSAPPPPPPAEIISKTLERLKGTAGFHFTIDRTGTLAYIDMNNTLAVNSIDGDCVTPDRVKGKIRVSLGGIPIEVSIISIQGRFWQTNPLNQTWDEYEPGSVFNPAILFDAEMGIQPMLQADLSDLGLVGTEKLDKWPDKELYHLNGKMKGERISEITFGLIGPEVLNVNIWVAPNTFEVHRIQIIDPVEGNPEPTTWTVDFMKFDQKVDIQPPTP